ncbi:unnamed protein product [Effrenium voratum]|nr:unnamed protein product [Effrenium voratum]
MATCQSQALQAVSSSHSPVRYSGLRAGSWPRIFCAARRIRSPLVWAWRHRPVRNSGAQRWACGARWQAACGLLVQDGICSSVLAACAEAAAWQAALKLRGSSADVVEENVAIHAMAKGKQWLKALEIYKSLELGSLRPTVVTYGAAINACAVAACWPWALELLATCSAHLGLTAIACNAAISACARADKWQAALGVFELVPPGTATLVTFNAALDACSKGGHWQQSIQLLARLSGALQPSMVTFTSAIQACERASTWPQALQLLSLMVANGVERSVPVCTAAIGACSKAMKWQLALHLVRSLERGRLAASVTTYLTAMDSLTAKLLWERSLALCEQLPSPFNTKPLDAVATAAARAEAWATTLALLPSDTSLALRGCRRWAVQLQLASESSSVSRQPWARQLAVLPREDLSPMRAGTLVAAVARQALWRRSVAVHEKIQAWGVQPDAFMSACVLAAMKTRPAWQPSLEHLQANFALQDAYRNVFEKLAARGYWQMAASALSEMRQVDMQPSSVSWSQCASACEKRHVWERSCGFFSHAGKTGSLSGMYNSVMSACEKSFQWPEAVDLLTEMRVCQVEPGIINYCTGISACDRGEHRDLGIALLWDSQHLAQTASALPWALARLGVRDLAWLRLAGLELGRIRWASETCRELANVAWALGVLGVRCDASSGVAVEAARRLRDFQLEDLVNLAWGMAATGTPGPDTEGRVLEVLKGLQLEMMRRASRVQRAGRMDEAHVEALLGITWACNLAGLLRADFAGAAWEYCRAFGARLDGPVFGTTLAALSMEVTKPYPRVELRLPDRLVLFKPAGWEVFGGSFPLQLHDFLRSVVNSAILGDPKRRHGFLHRLDVPTSGLILAACTYSAFYDLQFQLQSGQIQRDYVVLCHGLATRRESITARLSWRGNEPTCAGGQGKPSASKAKVVAHGVGSKAEAVSLVLVRIVTGRRHQIRSHFSFIGHPVYCDPYYGSDATYLADASFVARNFLHRYRLSFLAEELHEVTDPLAGEGQRISCVSRVPLFWWF